MEEEFYSDQNEGREITISSVKQKDDQFVLNEILNLLKPFNKKTVEKLIKIILTFYEIEDLSINNIPRKEFDVEYNNKFSENRDISPKEFMLEKKPQTDIEQIACLAYYLTHYKNQEEFKTIDLSKLNTEAAQLKFANAAVSVDHATRHAGFLLPTKSGFKKLSAIGELYVQALPDRDEAKAVLSNNRPRKKSRRSKSVVNV